MNSKITRRATRLAKPLFAIITIFILFSSCASYKKVPYFQDLNQSHISTEDLNNYTSFRIQPGDQLSIIVGSLNTEASAVFNNNVQAAGTAGTVQTNINYGYVVSREGEISLPLIGVFKVQGLTTAELSDQLKTKLLPFLREPKTYVTVVNFKVAVLGDVLRPNIYASGSERLTITEALSLAGDLNITADRKILLVREIDGKRMFVPIDLNSKDTFSSPYFYLKNNDLLFIQAGKLKLSTVDNYGYRNASLIISALSLVAIAISLLRH